MVLWAARVGAQGGVFAVFGAEDRPVRRTRGYAARVRLIGVGLNRIPLPLRLLLALGGGGFSCAGVGDLRLVEGPVRTGLRAFLLGNPPPPLLASPSVPSPPTPPRPPSHTSHLLHCDQHHGLVGARWASRCGAHQPMLPLAEPSQHREPKNWVLRQNLVGVAQVHNLIAVTVSPYHTDWASVSTLDHKVLHLETGFLFQKKIEIFVSLFG